MRDVLNHAAPLYNCRLWSAINNSTPQESLFGRISNESKLWMFGLRLICTEKRITQFKVSWWHSAEGIPGNHKWLVYGHLLSAKSFGYSKQMVIDERKFPASNIKSSTVCNEETDINHQNSRADTPSHTKLPYTKSMFLWRMMQKTRWEQPGMTT